MRPVGWLVLTGLTALAALDALGIAVRARPAGRAELGVIASAVFFAFLSLPVLALGYAGWLTPLRLGGVSLTVFAAAFALLARRAGVRALLVESRRAAAGLARMPLDALREAARARSVVLLGLLGAGGVVLAALVLTVFVPNGAWDGFLYHEPIIGFAIQNHGFAVVPLQLHQTAQAINGYPHLCESVGIWFVIFTDKTLIELPNTLAAPAMMLAAYVLVRRFGDRVTSMGWACVLLLVPQAWTQLCQTYIDVEVAFFALAALAFVTRPAYRLRDAVLATLALVLFAGFEELGAGHRATARSARVRAPRRRAPPPAAGHARRRALRRRGPRRGGAGHAGA